MESEVSFNFTYAPGITDEQILGIELAGEMWSNYLGDTHQYIDEYDVLHQKNTTINIHVEVNSDLLPKNVIGGAFPAISDEYEYEDIYNAINQDITTDNDVTAADSLLNSEKTNVLINGEVVTNGKFQLTKANLKALNIADFDSNNEQELDGYILISNLSNFSSIEWNYDYLGGAKPNTLDFLSTITHEIGHVLGFISGTDRVALTSETLSFYQNVASIDIIEQGTLIKESGRYSAQLDSSNSERDTYWGYHGGYWWSDSKDSESSNTYWGDDYDYWWSDSKDSESSNMSWWNYGDNTEDDGTSKFDVDYDPRRIRYKQYIADKNNFKEAIAVLQNVDNSTNAIVAQNAFQAVEKYLKYDNNWENFIEAEQLLEVIKDSLDLQKLASKMTSLDLFRYSTNSSNQNANELTRGANSYLSLDGSKTDLTMSNGLNYQGSHWQDREQSEGLGVMNPTIALNERWEISDNDLMALDAIGWDVDYDRFLDLQALHTEAAANVDSAWIGDRNDDVAEMIYGKAYEGRRSYSYWMNAGYFSTFSEPVSNVAESAERQTVIVNNAEQNSTDNSIEPHKTFEEREVKPLSIDKVATNYLEIDRSSSQSALLKEITESLNTGLEIKIASQTL